MIQFNLLPDVKIEYIKAQRLRRLIAAISVLATIAAIVLLGILVAANRLGSKHLSDLSKDITSQSKTLQAQPQINKILTVQNQLESLTALHSSKPAVPQLFDYLNRLTPAQVSITNITIDFTAQTATITGSSDSLSSVNQYVDTLKYTTYTDQADASKTKTPAFSNVVLSTFGLSSGKTGSAQQASYSIAFSYDMAIFDITKKIDLVVPSLVTTRSNVNQPTDLFTAAPSTDTTAGGTQ